METIPDRVSKKFFERQDPSGLGVARFLFGLLMIIDIFEERGLVYLVDRWGDPESCYFPLFNNLPRLPIEYLFVVYLILLISATGIMLGFMYRLSCACFALFYWYIFFLDKTVWNNHSYLYGLTSLLFLCTDGNYYFSIDGIIWPSIRNTFVPRWNYAIFRFQLFLLYFYAGIKKLDADWVAGYSMTGLSRQWIFDPFRIFFTNEQIDFFMIHICGLLFDLSEGFLLLFDKTRTIGFILAYSFHGMNAVMFNIGMFSYACMAMITIFCHPVWPKRIISKFPDFLQLLMPTPSTAKEDPDCIIVDGDKVQEIDTKKKADKGQQKIENNTTQQKVSLKKLLVYIGVLTYVFAQLTLPFSHFITKGYNSWTQGLYGYSWDMMVHSWDTQHVVIKIVDKVSGKKQFLRPGAFVSSSNVRNRIFAHPDMMKQYSTCLAKRMVENEEFGISQPAVYFDVWKSLNKRYQQRMIDPGTDLLSAPWSVTNKTPWLLPLLVELSPWRSTFEKIRDINNAYNNASDIVFVADFPNLYLENFIAPEIMANVTVLQGNIMVEIDSKNTSVSVNETLMLPSNMTHVIHTVSAVPSCYMYIYYNTTWVDLSQEALLKSDPRLEKTSRKREIWNKMSFSQKVYAFYARKLKNYKIGVLQIYYALQMILDDHSKSGDVSQNVEL